MHEISVCESVRRIVEEHARAKAVRRVRRVRLEIGRFSCVGGEAMRFAFDVVMKGSVADGAELVLVELPGRARCDACGRDVEIDDWLAPCPVCGSPGLTPLGGDEMRIRDMEVA